MSLFGDGRSEERRRRVLTEEVISGAKTGGRAPAESTTRSSRGAPHRYNDAARLEKRTRLTDLAPKSYGLLALWFFLGAIVIGGFEAIHFYADRLPFQPADGRIAAFDLGAEGSLATWFASFLLQAAAATALVVYSIRKHRADDYHARYRVWIAAAICWFVLSVDEAAGLHEGFQQLMIAVTGERGYGDGSVWWIGAYALVLGVVGLKLVLDMKECRTSTALFIISGLGVIGTVVVHLRILPIAGLDLTMLEEGLELAGSLFLLTSMAVHARYVILEATGEITPRVAKPRAERVAATKTSAGVKKKSFFGWFGKAKIDSPHGTPAPAGRSSDLAPTTSSRVPSSAFRPTTETLDAGATGRGGVKKVQADFTEEDDDDRRDNRKLSKAERKNLRRQKDFERRYGLSDE